MIQIAGQWAIRPEHVSAVGHPHSVHNRPGLYQMEVQLIGGQTLNLVAPKPDIDATRETLIQAITATG